MKVSLTAALLGALTIAAVASAQTNPPPIVAQTLVPVPAPPPSPPVITHRDGPYHLLLHARTDAASRRAHGLRADIVLENGMWWVVYYP